MSFIDFSKAEIELLMSARWTSFRLFTLELWMLHVVGKEKNVQQRCNILSPTVISEKVPKSGFIKGTFFHLFRLFFLNRNLYRCYICIFVTLLSKMYRRITSLFIILSPLYSSLLLSLLFTFALTAWNEEPSTSFRLLVYIIPLTQSLTIGHSDTSMITIFTLQDSGKLYLDHSPP